MSALSTIVRSAKTLQNATKLFSNLLISSQSQVLTKVSHVSPRFSLCCNKTVAGFHSTSRQYDLMEFFDNEKNWGIDRVRVGRSWRLDELRIKSNEDLHKLWFVLLKEKNMLLTMEEECKKQFEPFPNPERRDKVEESMENLEEVVRERNRAYYELETGEHGERPVKWVRNDLGLYYRYKSCQHQLHPALNKRWRETHKYNHFGGYAVSKFLSRMREKRWNEKRRLRNRTKSRVQTILRRYPNVDLEVLQAKYPEINIPSLQYNRRIKGHHLPRKFDIKSRDE